MIRATKTKLKEALSGLLPPSIPCLNSKGSHEPAFARTPRKEHEHCQGSQTRRIDAKQGRLSISWSRGWSGLTLKGVNVAIGAIASRLPEEVHAYF